MTPPRLSDRARTIVPIAVLVVLGATRIAEGARYVAGGLSPQTVLLNAGLFGGLCGLGCAMLLGVRPSRIAQWAAVSAIAWMVTGALALELARIRGSGAFVLSSWYRGAERGPGFVLEAAIIGAASACGSTVALLGRAEIPWRLRVRPWLAWGAFGAAASVVIALVT